MKPDVRIKCWAVPWWRVPERNLQEHGEGRRVHQEDVQYLRRGYEEWRTRPGNIWQEPSLIYLWLFLFIYYRYQNVLLPRTELFTVEDVEIGILRSDYFYCCASQETFCGSFIFAYKLFNFRISFVSLFLSIFWRTWFFLKGIKQVEINTVAASFGALTSGIVPQHK